MCTEMLAFLFTTICTFRQRFGPTIEFFNTVKIHKFQIIWVRMLYLYGKTYPVLPEMDIFLPEPVRERLWSTRGDDVIFRTGCPSSLVSANMLLCIHDLSHDGKRIFFPRFLIATYKLCVAFDVFSYNIMVLSHFSLSFITAIKYTLSGRNQLLIGLIKWHDL